MVRGPALIQLRLPELRCNTVVLDVPVGPERTICHARPTHMLYPGPTAHCDDHEVRWYATRDDAWADAFASGRARIVELAPSGAAPHDGG